MQFRKWRKPTFFFVDLEVNKVQFSVRMVDITQNGARLQGAHEVVDGTAGVITVRGHQLAGTLRWVRGGTIGFEFDEPLPAHLYSILAHKKTAAARKRFLVD